MDNNPSQHLHQHCFLHQRYIFISAGIRIKIYCIQVSINTMNLMSIPEKLVTGNCYECKRVGPLRTFCGHCRNESNVSRDRLTGQYVRDSNPTFVVFVNSNNNKCWIPERLAYLFGVPIDIQVGYNGGMGAPRAPTEISSDRITTKALTWESIYLAERKALITTEQAKIIKHAQWNE